MTRRIRGFATIIFLALTALASSQQVRIFHGFGPAKLTWRGRTWTIAREQTIAP